MEKKTLSAKQAEILQYLKEYIGKKGFPPSVREIGDHVHLKSTSSVHAHMQTLERRGYIRRDPNHPRAIDILDDDWKGSIKEQVTAPVLRSGYIPNMHEEEFWQEEDVESYFPLPDWIADHAGIPVMLHAMDEDREGLVLVDVGRPPKEGKPAAVRNGDGWMIKPYRKGTRAVCFFSMYEKEDAE